jgi:hypothetical protein
MSTKAVKGTATAQNIQELGWTILSLSACMDGIANNVAKKVLGKNSIVITAIVFMEELSFLAASANLLLASEISLLVLASSCDIREAIYTSLD